MQVIEGRLVLATFGVEFNHVVFDLESGARACELLTNEPTRFSGLSCQAHG